MHKCTFSCSLALPTSIQRTLKNWYFWFTAKVFNNHEKYTVTDVFTALLYWWSNRHPSSSGKWQWCTVKNKLSPWVPHTVLSPSDKQSSPCQPHFLPSNLPCGLVLCDGAHKQSVKKENSERKRQQWIASMKPCSCCEAIRQAACP